MGGKGAGVCNFGAPRNGKRARCGERRTGGGGGGTQNGGKERHTANCSVSARHPRAPTTHQERQQGETRARARQSNKRNT